MSTRRLSRRKISGDSKQFGIYVGTATSHLHASSTSPSSFQCQYLPFVHSHSNEGRPVARKLSGRGSAQLNMPQGYNRGQKSATGVLAIPAEQIKRKNSTGPLSSAQGVKILPVLGGTLAGTGQVLSARSSSDPPLAMAMRVRRLSVQRQQFGKPAAAADPAVSDTQPVPCGGFSRKILVCVAVKSMLFFDQRSPHGLRERKRIRAQWPLSSKSTLISFESMLRSILIIFAKNSNVDAS